MLPPEAKIAFPRDVHIKWQKCACWIVSETTALKIDGDTAALEKVTSALTSGTTFQSILATFDPDWVTALMRQLLSDKLLLVEVEPDEINERHNQTYGWLSSLTARPQRALKRLQRAHVCVIGVGGLGGQVLEHLVGSGVTNFVLVDGDRVERSNLNRQYQFNMTDIGSSKVASTRSALLAKAPDLNLTIIDRYIVGPGEFDVLNAYTLDLIINCADTPNDIEALVADFADRQGAAFLTGGLGLNRGYWGPLLKGQANEKLRNLKSSIQAELSDDLRDWSGEHVCRSSHGPYNSMIAAMMASDAIHYLTRLHRPRSADTKWVIDFQTMAVTEIALGEKQV
ncbi:HesA/MoeB/ThiF family protein [Sulfitobacter sp. R86518]|uniref:HesA/MoeB/ThiF family protein n=1 Tax=Sulfitobacter sp. R86518 TaxID=3093858 RepID=UPI0036DE5959